MFTVATNLLSKGTTLFLPLMKAFNWRYERICYLGKTIENQSSGNRKIAELIESNVPSAIGKIGNVELCAIVNYLRQKHKGDTNIKWEHLSRIINHNAGVFPARTEIFNKFCDEFLSSLGKMDLLAVWFNKGEAKIVNNYAPQATLIRLRALEPYYHKTPWTKLFHKKRILVVHPFAKTIESQYRKREIIWPRRQDILPEFDMETIRTPLSQALVKSEFKDWFEALDFVKEEMAGRSFDVAIIGAGAWSIPLTAHVKDVGKIGIHLGGATQVLFGIAGRRWDNHPIISKFYNTAWCRPSRSETPDRFQDVENGCYW